MVTDHRGNFDRQTATRSPCTGCASRCFQGIPFYLALLLLCQLGCQSVVDPGRSMNSARPPQGAIIQGTPPVPVVPPAMSPPPHVPAAPAASPSGVIRQPASSVIQLPQAAAGESKYHTVVAGETWASIARQYQMTVQQLTDANGIDPATKLQPGQLVYIPQK